MNTAMDIFTVICWTVFAVCVAREWLQKMEGAAMDRRHRREWDEHILEYNKFWHESGFEGPSLYERMEIDHQAAMAIRIKNDRRVVIKFAVFCWLPLVLLIGYGIAFWGPQ